MAEQLTPLMALRAKKGYDRDQFANALDVNRVTVWRWETGRQQMTAAKCREIAKLLNVTMEQVVKAAENGESR